MDICFPSFISFLLKIIVWPSLLFVFELQSLFFWFWIFFLEPLIEVLFVFNFILPSQFAIYIYIFNLVIIIFFLFFWAFGWIDFFFNFTIQSKIYFYFLFHFYPHSFDCFFPFSSINVSFQFHPSIKNKFYFVF